MRCRSIAAAVALATLVGCGNKDTAAPAGRARAEVAMAPSAAPAGGAPAPVSAASAYWSAQKLIRTAEMEIKVRDVAVALRAVDSVARNGGALIAETHVSQDEEHHQRANLELRVPAAGLGGALQQLRALGEVTSESVAAQDITKEYTDLETRLAVKEQTVTRLRALLDGHTAKLSDVLEVERELSREVTELEGMKGERRYYDEQVALSTVKLTIVDRDATERGSVVGTVGSAIHHSFEVLSTSVAALIYVLAFALPWAMIGGLAWWATRRWRVAGPKSREGKSNEQ